MTTYNSPFSGDVIQPTDVSYRAFTMSANLTLAWPINGNTSGNYAARIMDVTPTTGGLSLYMPPSNQVSVGTDSLITNKGAVSFNVVDNAGGAIVSIAPGKSWYIWVTDNSSVAGAWGQLAFGVGTSSPDASSLAGSGLLAIGSTLNQSHPVSSIANGYTFQTSDRAKALKWTGGSGAATLPLAATLGNNWFVMFSNSGTGSFTVATTGQLIDGSASKTFQPSESAFIVCDGTNYFTVGYGQSSTFVFNVLVKPVTGGTYYLTGLDVQNIIQEYVGTLTSNVTIVFPPIVGLYVISNQTTAGAYTLTVTTGLPGSVNTSIPTNGQATVFCDGTNFFNANTVQAGATQISVVDGTAGNPSINFLNEVTTGIYRPGLGQWGLSVLGTNVVTVDSNGIGVDGTGNFTGGISGGTFP